jgi:hypothetical protein
MPPEQPNFRALSKLTDVTRSVGVEYGLELLLWLTYARWRSLTTSPPGHDLQQLPPELLAEQLQHAANESKWRPNALTQSGSRGTRDARTIHAAFTQLDVLIQEQGNDAGDPRAVHQAVFEGLLTQPERLGARTWEASVTPARVARLMVDICAHPLGSVLDPAAGFGSASLAAHEAGATSLTAWDINESVLGLLRARTELAGAERVEMRRADTLQESAIIFNFRAPDLGFDTVLLTPPWNAAA